MIASRGDTRASSERVGVNVLYAAAFGRALATGMVGVLLGIYLARIGFDPSQIGKIIAAGLAGAAAAALIVTLLGQRVPRRVALVGLSLVAAAGGVVVAVSSGFAVVCVFHGSRSPVPRDAGQLVHAIPVARST